MEEIIRILMERDNATETDVRNMLLETIELISEALQNGTTEEIETIFSEMTGLETEYLIKIIHML